MALLEIEKFDLRIQDWVQQIIEMEDRDNFAGLPGLFFPLLHFYSPEKQYTIVLRCEPVLTFEEKDEIKE